MFRNLFERQQFYGDIKLCLSKTLSDLRKTGLGGSSSVATCAAEAGHRPLSAEWHRFPKWKEIILNVA